MGDYLNVDLLTKKIEDSGWVGYIVDLSAELFPSVNVVAYFYCYPLEINFKFKDKHSTDIYIKMVAKESNTNFIFYPEDTEWIHDVMNFLKETMTIKLKKKSEKEGEDQ